MRASAAIRAAQHDSAYYATNDKAQLVEACALEQPDVMFPDPGDRDAVEEAKAVCGRCAFRLDCMGKALREKPAHGVWGGLTETERESWARQQRRARRRTAQVVRIPLADRPIGSYGQQETLFDVG